MKDKERYTEIKTVRLKPSQVMKLEKLGITIREAVEFCIERKESPQLKLMDRKRELEKDIKNREFGLKQLNEELDKINKELGTTKELEETLSLDIILDGNNLIESYQNWNKTGKSTIDDYLLNKHFKRAFKHYVAEHGGNKPKEYEKQLLNYIKENHDKTTVKK